MYCAADLRHSPDLASCLIQLYCSSFNLSRIRISKCKSYLLRMLNVSLYSGATTGRPIGGARMRKDISNYCTFNAREHEMRSVFCVCVKAGQLWNALPLNIRTSRTFYSFKHGLKNWLFTSQMCEHEL